MGDILSRPYDIIVPVGLYKYKSGEVYLTDFPPEEPGKVGVLCSDPVRCSIAGQNLEVEVTGDHHAICVRGKDIVIHVEGEHTRLRVDGQNIKVIVDGQGTILYTNSNVSLEGTFQLAGRCDLTAPDCPVALPSRQGNDLTQEYCENNLFLNVIYIIDPRNDPEDDPGNRSDEGDACGNKNADDAGGNNIQDPGTGSGRESDGDAGGNNHADDAGGNNIQDPETGSGRESDGGRDEDTRPTSNAGNSEDRDNVLANDANNCVLNKITLNTGSKERKRTDTEADLSEAEELSGKKARNN